MRRDFAAAAPSRPWVAELTEFQTCEGKLHPAVVVDAFSRRCGGWALAEQMLAELIVDALQMAIWQRRPAAGPVYHSDNASTEPGQLQS